MAAILQMMISELIFQKENVCIMNQISSNTVSESPKGIGYLSQC